MNSKFIYNVLFANVNFYLIRNVKQSLLLHLEVVKLMFIFIFCDIVDVGLTLVLECYLFRVSYEWILVCSLTQCLQSSTMHIIFQVSKLRVVLNINSCLTSWNRTFSFCECLQLDKKNLLLPRWQVCSLCKFYTNKQMNKNRWWSFLSTNAVFIHDDNLTHTINFIFTIKLHLCVLHHP
jgi:hypothetical protein